MTRVSIIPITMNGNVVAFSPSITTVGLTTWIHILYTGGVILSSDGIGGFYCPIQSTVMVILALFSQRAHTLGPFLFGIGTSAFTTKSEKLTVGGLNDVLALSSFCSVSAPCIALGSPLDSGSGIGLTQVIQSEIRTRIRIQFTYRSLTFSLCFGTHRVSLSPRSISLCI